ncbi:MAG: DNA polymerase I [Candidatus Saganbacteria bacterium]|nr:DNA polymerase I [Candidatus Saganbacteria bacterium]
MEKRSNTPVIYLIDGNSLVYRAFYALPDTMKTASGITTNAIYGFTNMLLRLLDDKPDYIAIAFDRPEPTFRHKEYSEYKAQRQKAPDTLRQQFPYIKELISMFSIPVFEMAGFEADDIVATIAKKAEKDGMKAVIVTGDKDTFQLINDSINVLTAVKGITETMLYDSTKVKERFGIEPKFLLDYKSLAGDPSDNIPGIPGVGEKTAVSLISKFGDLESIIKNADTLEGKLKDKIKNNVGIARLSRRLAELVTDMPLDIDFKKLERKEIDWPSVFPLLEKFEFKSLLKKYGKDQTIGLFAQESREKVRQADENTDYKLIENGKDLDSLIGEIRSAGAFAFDTETTSLDTMTAKLIGISISCKLCKASFIPEGIISKFGNAEKLKDIFADSEIKKYGHNLKYDIEILNGHGIEVHGIDFDTMVAAYILDPTAGKFGLKFLGAKYFGKIMTSYEELMLADNAKDIKNTDIEDLKNYACADADITFRLQEVLRKELTEKGLLSIFSNIEVPLIEVLVKMEEDGVSIDEAKLSFLSKDVSKRIERLEIEIYAICGEKFNINSPKQLAEILFNKLKLPKGRKTKTGQSTDASVLESLAGNFEIAQKLLEYRQLAKLQSTYIDALPQMVNKRTGRIHTSFNQIITATGRLSSSDPNLQNIPIRSDLGKMIRDAFVPANDGDMILSADYSQIELRILAHLSKDPELIKDFIEDKDIHSATAADIFGVKFEEVTKEMRTFSKTINFGIVYGMSSYGLAKTLNIKPREAEEYISKYFNKYKGVKAFMDNTILFARKNGYVETLLGRRRYLRNIDSYNQNERQAEERIAVNTPVQGTAADIIKAAMIKIYNRLNVRAGLKPAPLRSKMILQIHDELVFECPKEEVEQVKTLVRDLMSTAVPLDVPVKVDIGVGKSWGQAK